MIAINFNANGFFEISANDDYIEQQFKKSQHWNKAQLAIIVDDIIVSAMNTIFEIYQHYPGNIVDVLQKLARINKDEQDAGKVFWISTLSIERVVNSRAIQDINNAIGKLYRLCTNNLYDFKLDKGLQNRRFHTKQQEQDLHEILNDFLEIAINAIQQSPVYQQAEQEERLYYNQDLLKVHLGKYVAVLPSISELIELEASTALRPGM